MKALYLFRLDDISWDMNYQNFCRIRDLFFQYNIHPIIGVIPSNKDDKLKKQTCNHTISHDQFWHEIRRLQKDFGWAIALHGYDHVYISDDSGILRINSRAEFAGLSLEEQAKKINKGKEIFEEQGILIDAFMAPAHSFDWNTIEALKQNDIFVITDGLAAYPYKEKGVLFIPQVWSWPRKHCVGVHTSCLHINLWSDERFKQLEKQIRKVHSNCTTFQDVVIAANGGKWDNYSVYTRISKVVIKAERFTISKLYKIKRLLLREES